MDGVIILQSLAAQCRLSFANDSRYGGFVILWGPTELIGFVPQQSSFLLFLLFSLPR